MGDEAGEAPGHADVGAFPEMTIKLVQAALLVRNLLIRNVGADSVISWPGNRDPQPPEKTISCKNILQLGNEGRLLAPLSRNAAGAHVPGGCRTAEMLVLHYFDFTAEIFFIQSLVIVSRGCTASAGELGSLQG